jgi:hypothetical protein
MTLSVMVATAVVTFRCLIAVSCRSFGAARFVKWRQDTTAVDYLIVMCVESDGRSQPGPYEKQGIGRGKSILEVDRKPLV